MKQIVAANPIAFLIDFEKAVKEGYFLTESVYTGPFLVNVWVDKKDTPECTVAYKPRTSRLTIEGYTFTQLCKQVEQLVAKGWDVDYNAFNFFPNGPWFVDLVRSEEMLGKKHTKEELDAMEWEELKALGKEYDSFNRARNVLTNMIMKAQEDSK